MDGLSQNLYVLVRNKYTDQQTVFVLDSRTRNRRTIVKGQRIQPSVIVVDPIKAELYWITRNSPSAVNIANLQGEVKRRAQLFTTESNVSYISYDPIAQDLIFTVGSVVYGLNTLDQRRLTPRVLYEHSSNIAGALFVHPVLYFTDEVNQTESSIVHLHAIDILAKSYARNVASLKNFGSLAVFADLAPAMSKSAGDDLSRRRHARIDGKRCSSRCSNNDQRLRQQSLRRSVYPAGAWSVPMRVQGQCSVRNLSIETIGLRSDLFGIDSNPARVRRMNSSSLVRAEPVSTRNSR